MNPLFNQLNGNRNDNGFGNLVNQFNQFKQTFVGSPKEEVQKLLNSGRMSQEQFNQLAGMANQLQQLLK